MIAVSALSPRRLPSLPAVVLAFSAALTLLPAARAADLPNAPLLDAQVLAQMEQRASQANPRERCFLYTELVNALTEAAGHELLSGDTDHARATFQHISALLGITHTAIAHDTKRLKNAEMLMHHTVYRLGAFLHAASSEDRDVLQVALKQADAMDTELMAQVFLH